MSVKAKFRLIHTERTALFKPSSKQDFEQTGWGTTVRLQQEAKMFHDAPAGAEFEITIAPAKDRGK